jgi:hypothetical protein
MNPVPFIAAGYAITLAAIIGYLWRLRRLERRLEREEGARRR